MLQDGSLQPQSGVETPLGQASTAASSEIGELTSGMADGSTATQSYGQPGTADMYGQYNQQYGMILQTVKGKHN